MVNLGELRQELLDMAEESEASSPSPPEPSPESPPSLEPLTTTEFMSKEIEELESEWAKGPRRVDWDLLLSMLIEYAPTPSRIVAANARPKEGGGRRLTGTARARARVGVPQAGGSCRHHCGGVGVRRLGGRVREPALGT